MYSQWLSSGLYCAMVGWAPAPPVSHKTSIKSFDLEYGTVGMDCCCAADVILQSLHLASISKVAVNTDNHMFEACKILQTKDEATFPILELAPCP